MSSIGQEIKKQRELRKIGLDEIANETKISIRFLRAIEEDNFQVLPEGVYRRNFIASYANYIGIDSQALVDIYKEMFEKTGSHHQDTRISRAKKKQIIYGIYIALVFIVITFVIIFWGHRKTVAVAQNKTASAVIAVPDNQAEKSGPANSSDNKIVKNEYIIPKADMQNKLSLDIVAIQDTWLEIKTDGDITFKWLLKKNEKRRFTADSAIEFSTIGNAGGIEVYYNNAKLQSFGKTGQIIKNLTITKETVKQYEGSASKP